MKYARNVSGLVCGSVVALFVGFHLLHNTYFHVASLSWEPVDATVVERVLKERSAELRYTYKIDGNEYTGDTFCFLSEGTIYDLLIIAQQYNIGDQIEVYVNPRNPNQSVVERRSLHLKYLWIHLVVVGFTGMIAVGCCYKLRKKT